MRNTKLYAMVALAMSIFIIGIMAVVTTPGLIIAYPGIETFISVLGL